MCNNDIKVKLDPACQCIWPITGSQTALCFLCLWGGGDKRSSTCTASYWNEDTRFQFSKTGLNVNNPSVTTHLSTEQT